MNTTLVQSWELSIARRVWLLALLAIAWAAPADAGSSAKPSAPFLRAEVGNVIGNQLR